MKKGVILNNIGSPDAPDTKSVRVYLREFLMDPGVIELPFVFRFLLVYGIITPFRASKSAEKYRKIWTAAGSPLVYITQSIASKIRQFKSGLAVETGMLFQNPSIKHSLEKLSKENPDLEKIYFIPMYPQFSAATTEAANGKFKEIFEKNKNLFKKTPEVYSLKPFYAEEFFINNYVEKIRGYNLEDYDTILFSYHGLPKKAILKNPHCQLDNKCCETGMQKNCYRSQCYATTKAILKKLNTKTASLTTFQSRLGPAEWIQPYTDQTLIELAQKGTKKILVICPAFTVDCLETLEEIQLENRHMFLEAGGSTFDYVPCLNDDDQWCQDLATIIDNGVHFDRL
jgi:protoporphyrin/coproporphyrin ferrochelatase